jgi:2-polyprenyl-3-methyl-5-hydroxy-6-metoxy-1,4-benzoquinol methylase
MLAFSGGIVDNGQVHHWWTGIPGSITSGADDISIIRMPRRMTPEIMDQPGLSAAEHAAALRGLKRIHRFSRTLPHLVRALEPIMKTAGAEPVTVLDIACGGGDLLCDLSRVARARGWNARFVGTDISEQALEIARGNALAGGHDIEFFPWNAVRDPLPGRYDVVMCTLFLHHLTEAEAARLLGHMATAAQRMVLADDLVRSPVGYALALAGCRLLSRSPVVHFDGPVSVQAAYTPDEIRALAEKAGLTGCRVSTHWPKRYLLSWSPR